MAQFSRYGKVSYIFSRRFGITHAYQIRNNVTLLGRKFQVDTHTNITAQIESLISRRLYLQDGHPINITCGLVASQFPEFVMYGVSDSSFIASPCQVRSLNPNKYLSPIVSIEENFDSLDFSASHPGRSQSDTYYVNSSKVLRTHTSAHQMSAFRNLPRCSPGFLIIADVYRKDAIDRSHYPVFHQMECARVWRKSDIPKMSNVVELISMETKRLSRRISGQIHLVNDCPHIDERINPLQDAHFSHRPLVECISSHLKRYIEMVLSFLFFSKEITGNKCTSQTSVKPLQIRWIPAKFPFTSPSYELEIFWKGRWVEILGCGVIRQSILDHSHSCSGDIGWAFGLGIERLSMLLFDIPDIRIFWSTDSQIFDQFSPRKVIKFVPPPKHPPVKLDLSFWLPSGSNSEFQESIAGIIKNLSPDAVEAVSCIDKYMHPVSGRMSLCFRITYRHLPLEISDIKQLHKQIANTLAVHYNVTLR